MNLLRRSITYQQLVAWGATAIYSDELIRRWMGPRGELTVGEMLSLDNDPSRILWAVVREQLMPAREIRLMAIAECRRFIQRLDERGVYIDFRTPRAVDAERAYLSGEISLGQLAVARRKAVQALEDVSELHDPLASTCAAAAVKLANRDASDAFRGLYYLIRDCFGHSPEVLTLVRHAAERLEVPDAR